MNCKEATKSYEAWLANSTRVINADLQLKHQEMKADVFSFVRATFYRWLELWSEQCAALAKGPMVLAVGDLHVENFGTYRAEPAAGHDGITMGLPIFRDQRELRLDRLLTQPFRTPAETDQPSTAPMTEVRS